MYMYTYVDCIQLEDRRIYGVPLRTKYPSGKISSQNSKKVIENKISVYILKNINSKSLNK